MPLLPGHTWQKENKSQVALQAFSHMGVQASRGRSLSTENCSYAAL